VIPTPEEAKVAYLVARGTEPVVIKEMPSLEAALEYAGQLISDNYANVAIHDGKGNQISGDDLIACYLGVKRLTPGLRAADDHQSSGRC
jgi:hypothetical protein